LEESHSSGVIELLIKSSKSSTPSSLAMVIVWRRLGRDETLKVAVRVVFWWRVVKLVV
jgi:hypothetical protein